MTKRNEKKDLRWLLVVPVILVIGVSLWWYMSTNNIRKYKARSYELRLISERQKLEIDIYNQGVQLRKIQVANQPRPRPPQPLPPLLQE